MVSAQDRWPDIFVPKTQLCTNTQTQLNLIDLYLIPNSGMVVFHRVCDDLLSLFLTSAKVFDQLVVDTWRFVFVSVNEKNLHLIENFCSKDTTVITGTKPFLLKMQKKL